MPPALSPAPSSRPLWKSTATVLFGILLLCLAIGVTVWLVTRQQQTTQWVEHSQEVRNGLTEILADLQTAESSQRGYLLSRDPSFLIPYRAARRRLPEQIGELQARVRDNPDRVRELRRVETKITARLDQLEMVIAAMRERGSVTSEDMAAGRRLMNDARDELFNILDEEGTLLVEREATAGRQLSYILAALLLSGLAVVLVGGHAYRRLYREMQSSVDARADLAAANDALIAEAASREATEAQNRQLHKMEAVGQLTGGIAHDFNNMLTIVMGSLEVAGRRMAEGNSERAALFMGNAMEGAQRASQLTARLMAFARQQPLSPRQVDANALVGGMSELLRRTLGDNVRLETVLAGGLWRTMVDPPQLENALVNLCVNARDAMPDGGRITIETANTHLDDRYAAGEDEVTPGQYVMVSVTDAGAGMDPATIERAFDPFFTTKGVGRGTGLGLSQVFGFVKQSHGHVKIYSEPGSGTTVKIYLPRSHGPEGDTRPDTALNAEQLPRAKEGETILVVEDDPRVRNVSVESLRELGYRVLHADSAASALAVLDRTPGVDLLFTDVVMPDVGGHQLAMQVRELRPTIRVLYTTGYTRNAIVHNGLLDPDVDLLPKPFTLTDLARKVRLVLDRPA